jgi:hypothetical protein
MKLTIIPEDKIVYVDSVSFSPLEFSFPSNIHALQWQDTQGWIEFVDNNDRIKNPNEIITEIPSWANIAIEKWNDAKLAFDAQQEELARLAEELKAQPTVL